MKKTLWVIGLSSIVLLTACNSKVVEKKEEGKYSVTSPLMIDTCYFKDYVAQIQSIKKIEIRPKIEGYIETVNVDEGQHVNAGQVLFTIRPKEYQAELLKANAEAKTAEIELQNTKILDDGKVVSPTEMEVAKAKLEATKAEQTIAEINLSYTKIVAPFDGFIDRLYFKAGSLVDNSSLLTTLSNNTEVYAYFNVSEVEYLNYKNHQSNDDSKNVSLILANNHEFDHKGIIQTIAQEFDNNTGNISFRAKFPNPDLLLKNGETGKVQMKIDIKNALIIPQKATYDIQDKIYVYVLDENNTLKSRNITVKQSLSNLYIVESGLNVNDKILLEGLQLVKDEDKIVPNYIHPKQVIQNLQLIKQ